TDFGSGTQNYVPKFNNAGGTTIGNSQIYDNGTDVGIGTGGSPNAQLDIKNTSGSEYEINTGNASYVQLQVGSTAVARVYAN
ncbi:MAG: hypothetical protein KGL04_01635, partial [Elusimicrobia bacterium]|nr:hypothetical protein [Elusimicrobiota bacterium]